jgi:HD-GYP domain-containing protein (c-di-GMP phosphodiesterase class II)
MGFSTCLHDIGKLRIPKTLIDKPGQFDPAEREVMQAHVLEGLNVVGELRDASRHFAPDAILHHHECFDGSGYPNGLHGEDLPEIARMARICDFYDAVRFDRPYRPGLGRTGALALMDHVSGQFDPVMLKVLKTDIAGIESVVRMRPN